MITAHHLVFGKSNLNRKILDLPFQNNFTDTTGINTMVAGGTSNLPTFTLDGSEYAAVFNGSKSLKTNTVFTVGTDKVSISFWIKTSQTNTSCVLELSTRFDVNNAFGVFVNSTVSNRITIADENTEFNNLNTRNIGYSAININNNQWRHIVLTIDRSLIGNQQNKIYVDGVLSSIQSGDDMEDFTGYWSPYTLFIGQRAGNSIGFKGQLKFLKIFNYPLSPSEITNLYNKTM